jgi:hypothetical protein
MTAISGRNFMLILLASALGATPLWATQVSSAGQATQSSTSPASDTSLSTLLARVQSTARKSDEDLASLHIDRWKTDSTSKQQAQATANSIHRNLVAAVPELVQQLEAAPGSLAANFRLYRDLNALYETFAAFVESAGAFGPNDQYNTLAADLNELDQARHLSGDRVDLMASAKDAELARLRARPATPAATAPAPPVKHKIVVDDNKPAAKSTKKKKKTTSPPPSSEQ